MIENAKAAVLASLAADSLALGVHWIYNTRVIDKKLGRVEAFVKPEIASFHRGKEKGDLTHYGDQMMVLLESAAQTGGFDLDNFAKRWQSLFADYEGYMDKATKATLDNFAGGGSPQTAGSDSTDLGGAARIAALLPFYIHDPKGFTAAAKAQTAMTHNHPEVVASAEFFAQVALAVFGGEKPSAAIHKTAQNWDSHAAIPGLIEDGLASAQADTRQTIADFGQMCETEVALPATVHLIVKYEDNLKEALIENVMAGGDSSARGMLAGMILGAHHGKQAIPDSWLSELRSYDQAVKLMSNLD